MDSPFLALPFEIRNSIYHHAVDWPDLSVPFQKMKANCLDTFEVLKTTKDPKCTFEQPGSLPFNTPTILLLNRQITSEALWVLHKKTLTIASPPPSPLQLAKPMDITEFIGEAVLLKVRHVKLVLDFKEYASRDWVKMVENLLDVWCQENSLESLQVQVEAGKQDIGNPNGAQAQDRHIGSIFSRVSSKRF